MQIGDKATRQPVNLQGEYEETGKGKHRQLSRKTLTGSVVYLHPERRFYVMEFTISGRTIREAFYFYPRSSGE